MPRIYLPLMSDQEEKQQRQKLPSKQGKQEEEELIRVDYQSSSPWTSRENSTKRRKQQLRRRTSTKMMSASRRLCWIAALGGSSSSLPSLSSFRSAHFASAFVTTSSARKAKAVSASDSIIRAFGFGTSISASVLESSSRQTMKSKLDLLPSSQETEVIGRQHFMSSNFAIDNRRYYYSWKYNRNIGRSCRLFASTSSTSESTTPPSSSSSSASTECSEAIGTTTSVPSSRNVDDDRLLHLKLNKYDQYNRIVGLGDKYDPQSFEENIYRWYESQGCFTPDAKQKQQQQFQSESPSTPPAFTVKSVTANVFSTTKDDTNKPYVLPMPPPNVTGRLHMGHAIFVALQDVLARFHRMRGRPVLWLPGTDHAGIATQLQVEKILASENTSRTDVGRDEFLRRVWEYKNEQGSFITDQLRALGASADWTRERFTMDEDLSSAVVEAFVRLHERGLIYKGEYMVNWAPMLQTAVSDLEVDYTDEMGRLYYFKYVLVSSEDKQDGNSDDFIPVATTRPETIMGDTAVCVNPNDERFKHLIGKRVIVPLTDRTIPVIADEYVDIDFGTGALKITPGHDPNDYAIGKKFNLPIINIMNKDGTMNENAGDKYNGMDRFECRKNLWNDMVEAGLTIQVKENHPQRVPRSQRGGDIIEPMVSRQWFVKTENMAAKALAAVQNGDIQIIPNRFEKIWYNWLSDNRDWCISRQLWWGHRIPVWYISNNQFDKENASSDHDNKEPEQGNQRNINEIYIVARNEQNAREQAISMGYPSSVQLSQEEDVLDTWFSSGLWPFATVGWPQDENNADSDLARFYPATCLETGYDILFFWVARMVMMGIELTGKSPFEVVYLHGLVRAADGTKMSKTKGNVVDPIDTVRQYGADSLRYSLVTGVTPGQDVPLNMEKIESNRNFANKLWNCCKFVTGNALRDVSPGYEWEELAVTGPMSAEEFDSLALPERYIVSRCHAVVEAVTADIENYQLGAAGSRVYEFLWDEFADWYIEVSKTRLYNSDDKSTEAVAAKKAAQRVLVYVLDTSLRLLHPYMPYVTEQLWHHLPRRGSSDDNQDGITNTSGTPNALMLSDWPQMKCSLNGEQSLVSSAESVAQFQCFQSLTRKIRNARAEYNVEPGKKISAYIIAPNDSTKSFLEQEIKSLVTLARLDPDQVFLYEIDTREAGDVLRAHEKGESVQLVSQDGVVAYLPLANLIDPVKERNRLQREYDKLDKEIDKLRSRLELPGFVDKAPSAVVEKARKELNELVNQITKVQASLDGLS